MIKKIKRGQMIPKFYGPIRRDIITDETIVMPMPFNIIAGMFIAITSSLRWFYIDICSNPRDAYEQGYNAGKAAKDEHS